MRTLSLRILMVVVAFLPVIWRRRAIQRLAALRYRRYFSGIRPQAANLSDRLGVPSDDAEAILRRSFELELYAIADGIRMESRPAAGAISMIEIQGLDRLDTALQAGAGAVLTTGHVDGLTVFFIALGRLGYRPSLIRLRAHDRKGLIARWLYERYNRRLERHGCDSLWMEPGGVGVGIQALRTLRRNHIVISPIDLTQSTDNAAVSFFGETAPFPRGMALLARSAGAPLFDVFVYRAADAGLVATIGPQHDVTDVDIAVQHSASALEEAIRVHPADWRPWHVFDQWRFSQDEMLSSPHRFEPPIAGA